MNEYWADLACCAARSAMNRIWLKGVVWYVLPVGGPGVAAVGVLDVGPAVFTGLERSDQVVSTIL
ncbi:hypothetical protein A5733_02095 [Mycobacterium sp. NS-7484]|nr:hypothetical protein A5733_02095 [Mycobacterium sp. NS-7484]